MLRCESVIPRRSRLTRRLATWSFAILVIGGAAIDATVLSKQPTQQRVNVTAAVAPERGDPGASTGPIDTRGGVNPFAPIPPRVQFLDPGDPRPQNRFDVDGADFSLSTFDKLTPVELRAPKGCIIHINTQSDPAPLRARLPLGEYAIWSSCDPVGTPITRLRVIDSRGW